MRVPSRADAWVLLVVACGGGTLAFAATRAASASLLTVALLGAAVLLTEGMEVPAGDGTIDPLGAHRFSFSSGVHIGAVLLVGPWAAALVAAGGVLVSDGLRGSRPKHLAYNVSVFALAVAAGGLVFRALVGSPDPLALPEQLPAVAVLAGVIFTANTVLVGIVQSLSSGVPLGALEREKLAGELPALAGEAGLGLALAVLAQTEPWAIIALVPLVFGVYQAHARLATLRAETSHALESFANLVDERDPTTFRHSARVADLVGRLGQSLRLPPAQVRRLRWAGRLHDLGKIAVDSTALRRPHDLSRNEWELMRRHPRLSARLVRRFRLAGAEARAIEYHHERYDGDGYYGIRAPDIPLSAHFLIVADSYDAMVSDRPYRRRLPQDLALAEIEKGAGTQFHPVVAKAFVALQRGLDPRTALTRTERAELRRVAVATGRMRTRARRLVDAPSTLLLGSLVVALVALAFTWYAGAAAALAAFAAQLAFRVFERARVRRIATALAVAGRSFEGVVGTIHSCATVRWAGLFTWREAALEGELEREWGDPAEAPTETAVTSWLVRDADLDDELLVTEGALGRGRISAALPLRRDGEIRAYLVVQFAHPFRRFVTAGLVRAAPDLAAGLASSTEEAKSRVALAAVR